MTESTACETLLIRNGNLLIRDGILVLCDCDTLAAAVEKESVIVSAACATLLIRDGSLIIRNGNLILCDTLVVVESVRSGAAVGLPSSRNLDGRKRDVDIAVAELLLLSQRRVKGVS